MPRDKVELVLWDGDSYALSKNRMKVYGKREMCLKVLSVFGSQFGDCDFRNLM